MPAVAVPFCVAAFTDTVLPLAVERLIVKSMVPVSLAEVWSLMETVGGLSSSVIVTVVAAAGTCAKVAVSNRTWKVSFSSSSVSPKIGTLTVLDVSPAVKVSRSAVPV